MPRYQRNTITADESFVILDAQLEELERRVTEDIKRAMEQIAPAVQDAAQATTVYNNVTGATRASTVAYVLGLGDAYHPSFFLAFNEAESLNPGHGDPDPPRPPLPGEITLYVLSATDYSKWLNERRGSASAYLLDAIATNSGALQAAVNAAIRRYFR